MKKYLAESVSRKNQEIQLKNTKVLSPHLARFLERNPDFQRAVTKRFAEDLQSKSVKQRTNTSNKL